MATKRISAFTSIGAYTNIATDDVMLLNDTNIDQERKVSLEQLALYALGGAEIGGTDSGDIVTIDDTQTMTNKRLNSPKFNSADAMNATSAELNHSVGVTSAIQTQLNAKAPLASPTFTGTVVLPSTTSIGPVTKTEIARLSGVTGSIQSQINGIVAGIQSVTSIVRCYTVTHTLGSGVTNKVINEATIRAAVYSGYESYRVNHLSVMAQAFLVRGDGSSHSKTLDQVITISNQSSLGVTFLDEINFKDLTELNTYAFVITCQLKAGPQGT